MSSDQPGSKRILHINDVDYTFRWCPPGEFQMGSLESEAGHYDDETPHRVRLTRGFFLLETPVTQRMWESVMGTTVCQQRDKENTDWGLFGVGPDYPMYYVDWKESFDFCCVLSELSGERITLPTEAQWEYACRAGTTGPYAGTGNLDDMGWCDENSNDSTHRVKEKRPNAWGLYDMHGNVWEWCSDMYDENYHAILSGDDPKGSSDDSYRVIRGGSWYINARYCRSARRGRSDPGLRCYYLGFRPVLVLVPAVG